MSVEPHTSSRADSGNVGSHSFAHEHTQVFSSDTGGVVPVISAFPPAPEMSTDRLSEELPPVPGFEVLGVLGRGGMGVVYKARQIRLNRVVALKMVLAGAHAGPLELIRFRTEAEAIAQLQHPNIVQIHDVGEHDGCPFISLEFVDGGSLTGKIATASLPARQAAALVESLARTVHFAHQRSIVHRDLKPANILMAADGTPKITDFGLAKRIGDTSSQTRTGDLLGTPNYMAPEQAEGINKDIGPATDVYALGAILYEVLTGRPPFKAETPFETVLLVVNEEPVPPTQLQPKLPRDLETICLKCLEKSPAKRYASAEALADDLRRFLDHVPIRARPVRPWERAYKWAKRRPAHAGLVAVSALAAATLLGGGWWYNIRLLDAYRSEAKHAERAEKRLLLVRRAVDDMYTQVAEQGLANESLTDETRRALLQKALLIYQELTQEDSPDPAVRKEAALAYVRVGQICTELGQRADGEAAYDRAATLLLALTQEEPAVPGHRQELANARNWLGELLRTGGTRLDEAENAYRAARDLQQRLADEAPNNPEYRRELARSLDNLAVLQMDRNRPSEAITNYAEAIRLLEELRKQHPDHMAYGHELARVHVNQGIFHKEAGRAREAETDYREAIDLLARMKDEWRNKPGSKCELAVCYNNLGNLLSSGQQHADAAEASSQGLALLVELTRDFPLRPAFRSELANAHNSLGNLHFSRKENANALREWACALHMLDELVVLEPRNAEYRFRQAQTAGNIGWLHVKSGAPLEAKPFLERSIAVLQETLAADPENERSLKLLRERCWDLATLQLDQGEYANAAQTASLLVQASRHQKDYSAHAARLFSRCATAAAKDTSLDNKTRFDAMRGYADQAMNALKQAVRLGYRDLAAMKNDRDLDPIRQRADFLKLLNN